VISFPSASVSTEIIRRTLPVVRRIVLTGRRVAAADGFLGPHEYGMCLWDFVSGSGKLRIILPVVD
jgi:hypothetical protein